MAFCVRGNLDCLHKRNFRCAFVVCVKLRGFRGFGGTSGAFGGGFMSFGGRFVSFGGRVWSLGGRSSFPLFGELGGFCRCCGTLILRFVYIFRSVGGVLLAREHRAVGGSSDGGVKGIPLNNPHFG